MQKIFHSIESRYYVPHIFTSKLCTVKIVFCKVWALCESACYAILGVTFPCNCYASMTRTEKRFCCTIEVVFSQRTRYHHCKALQGTFPISMTHLEGQSIWKHVASTLWSQHLWGLFIAVFTRHNALRACCILFNLVVSA